MSEDYGAASEMDEPMPKSKMTPTSAIATAFLHDFVNDHEGSSNVIKRLSAGITTNDLLASVLQTFVQPNENDVETWVSKKVGDSTQWTSIRKSGVHV